MVVGDSVTYMTAVPPPRVSTSETRPGRMVTTAAGGARPSRRPPTSRGFQWPTLQFGENMSFAFTLSAPGENVRRTAPGPAVPGPARRRAARVISAVD